MFNMLNTLLRMREKDLLTDWEVFYSKNDGYFTNYSWYHIMWLVIMVALCILFCVLFAVLNGLQSSFVLCCFSLCNWMISIFFNVSAGRIQRNFVEMMNLGFVEHLCQTII